MLDIGLLPKEKGGVIMEKVIDYYNGFEGEPEIQMVHIKNNQDKYILRMWIGYFDRIIELIKPEAEGWTGLSYYYHMNTGWYEDSPWRISDVISAKKQIESINPSTLDDVSKKVYSEILNLFNNASSSGETILISYD